MSELHIYKAGGYIGEPERRTTVTEQVTINEQEWIDDDIMMPMNVREIMHEQARRADDVLRDREYTDVGEGEASDSQILLPPAVRR